MEKEKLAPIYELMPTGWKEAAKETGAMVRSRKISTPEELLRLNFLYQTSGDSYGLTAALTQISENQEGLNKTAVQKRIINSRKWLKWLCLNLCRQEDYIVEPPEWLKDYRVCLTDASNYSKKGSKQADVRFHYMVELFTLNMVEMYFTGAEEGEKLSRYQKIREKDIIIGDRAYGTIKGMQHVRAHGGEFLLRFKANSFNLYTESGEKYDLTKHLESGTENALMDLQLYYKDGNKFYPIRICVSGKKPEDVEKSQRQIKRSNTKDKRGKVSDLQQIYSRYIIVATSLPSNIYADKILELYRMRWQIEIVFKRLKSIFGGEFSAKRHDAIESWFYGKLLLAIICETLVKHGRFSPYTGQNGL